jgi:hypothetical protein
MARNEKMAREATRMLRLEFLIPAALADEVLRKQLRVRPEDPRRNRALAMLGALAEELPALNGSSLHERLVRIWDAEAERGGERDRFSEIVCEELRAIGVTSFPATAREMLEGVARRLERDTRHLALLTSRESLLHAS